MDVIVNRYMEQKGSADDIKVIRNGVTISYEKLMKEGDASEAVDLP